MSESLSAKQLKQAQAAINSDPTFKQLGSIDLDLAIRVVNICFQVVFDGFSCKEINKLKVSELRDVDCVLKFTRDQWTRFIEGCRTGTGPSLIDLDTIEGLTEASSPIKQLLIPRYHLSLQAFFEAYANLDKAQAA